MNALLERSVHFFVANTPSWHMILIEGPIGLVWSLACLWFAGCLKRSGLRTGYTRKVFHFLIFTTVAALQWTAGSRTVCLFGAACSSVVFLAVLLGNGNLLYEAMAREKDAPHRTYFILIPYFTTLIGGILSNIFFGPAAIAGYLVAGLGDAIGEPVGTRFGRHTYRVPSLASVPAYRSWEGSTAVFLASCAAVALAMTLSPHLASNGPGLRAIVIVAAASALAEAVSPHGWDNATLQVLPSWLVWMLARNA